VGLSLKTFRRGGLGHLAHRGQFSFGLPAHANDLASSAAMSSWMRRHRQVPGHPGEVLLRERQASRGPRRVGEWPVGVASRHFGVVHKTCSSSVVRHSFSGGPSSGSA